MVLELISAWAALAQAPDSVAQARMGDAISQLRDSLSALQGASAAFSRDLPTSSRHIVLTRAADVRARCVGSATAAAQVDSVYARHASVLSRDPAMPPYRRELRSLQAELARCQDEWQTPYVAETADSLRAWGPHRLGRLDAAVRRHSTAAASLPYGRPKVPSSSGVGR